MPPNQLELDFHDSNEALEIIAKSEIELILTQPGGSGNLRIAKQESDWLTIYALCPESADAELTFRFSRNNKRGYKARMIGQEESIDILLERDTLISLYRRREEFPTFLKTKPASFAEYERLHREYMYGRPDEPAA